MAPEVDEDGARLPLRERNRLRAREDIAAAALALFRERGFDAVTIDDIADEAGISSRTFFRYFESKEEALLPDYPELDSRLVEALGGSASGLDLVGRVNEVTHRIADYYVEHTDVVLVRSKIISEAGAPTAKNLEYLIRWEQAIASAVAAVTGDDPKGLRPRTTAATVVGAFRAALGVWVRSGATLDLHHLVDEAMDHVAGGLRG